MKKMKKKRESEGEDGGGSCSCLEILGSKARETIELQVLGHRLLLTSLGSSVVGDGGEGGGVSEV